MGIPPSQVPEKMRRRMSEADRRSSGKALQTQPEADETYRYKSEREMHDTFETWLRVNDIVYIHSRMDKKTRNARGIPDFCFSAWGKPVAIEFKMPDEMPTEDQTRTIGNMRRNGWRAEVCYTVSAAIRIAHSYFECYSIADGQHTVSNSDPLRLHFKPVEQSV